MQNSYKIATIGGIEVFIHWTWLFAFAFITWSLGDYFYGQYHSWNLLTAYIVGGIAALLLFTTVLIHELAHSFTARANGLPVKTIYLFIFGGVSNLSQEPETPRTELLVAIAGPLASLVLAALFFVLFLVTKSAPSQVTVVLGYLATINVILAVFNLIPGFPLDGGRVLRASIWLVTDNLGRATQIAGTVGNGIGYLFILGGLIEALVLGQFYSGLWLAFIGWFLHNAASATTQQASLDRLLLGIDVRNVMDQIANTAAPDTPIEALVYRHMLNENQRALPVTETDGTLVGLVTLGDTRNVPREEWGLVPVSRIMTPRDKLLTVAPDASLRDALQIMAEEHFNQIPVMRDGRLVGMLNRGHVLQYIHVRQRLQATSADSGNV